MTAPQHHMPCYRRHKLAGRDAGNPALPAVNVSPAGGALRFGPHPRGLSSEMMQDPGQFLA